MTLTEFIEARLAEMEADAPDLHDARHCSSLDREGGFTPGDCDCGHPARVLREVEAKRAIVEAYKSRPDYDIPEGWAQDGRDPDERLADEAAKAELLDVVMTLASVYSDHPDYQTVWSDGT